MGIKLLPFSVLFLFASGQALAQNPNPTSITPNSGVGYTTTFTAVYSDPNGAAHIDVASLAVTPNLGANPVCTVAFEFGAFWLTNDTGTALFGPLTPGSSSAISNSQCTLSGQGSSATPNGNNLSVTFKLTFSTSYAGSKQMWMYVSDSANGLNSGFQNFGSWTVGAPQPPAVTSLNPPPGSGLYQPFTGTYSDASGGGSQIDVATIAIVPYLGSSNACVVGLEFGLFWLTNDAATGLVGPLAQGSSGTISNSQCTVSGQGASFNASGNNLTFTVPITFNASFSGTQQIWMYTSDAVTGLNSGWHQMGTWTVPGAGPPSFTMSATPVTAYPGVGTQFTVSVSGANGFSSPVNLSYDPTVWPLTMYPTFGSFTVNPGGSVSVSITVLNSASGGTYVLPVNGAGGGLTASALVTVTIGPPPGGGPAPRVDSGCGVAEVTGMSRVTPNLATGAVTGYSMTEVNTCAYSWGYQAGVVAGLFKGSDEYATSVDPSSGIKTGQSVTASTSAQSTDGDIYQLITDHFVDVSFTIEIDIYGDIVYRDPLGFSSFASGGVEPSGDSTGSYDETGTASVVYIVDVFIGYTGDSAFASDPTPQISSISPNSWDVGTFPVVIQGSGFGVSPQLDISPDDGLVHWNLDSWSDTFINAIVTVDPDATPGNRVVSVLSAGSIAGLGFQSGPGRVSKSSGVTVLVNGSPCTITIANDGQTYPINSPDYRTAMFQLQANSPQCQGMVTWTVTFSYATRGGRGSTLSEPFYLSGQLNQPADFYTTVGVGGKGSVRADVMINNVATSLTATIYVVGTTIPEPTVTAQLYALGSSAYTGPTRNILTGIASVESAYDLGAGEFATVDANGQPLILFGVQARWPNESLFGGGHIGLMQVPTNGQVAWDWMANAQQGANVLQGSYNLVLTFSNKQIRLCGGNLPALTLMQREQNAVAGYNIGFTRPYWVADATCRKWVINKPDKVVVDYVTKVYGRLR